MDNQSHSVGADVAKTVITAGELELPNWLSVPDPKPPTLPAESKDLLVLQYGQMFERLIEQIFRGRSLQSLIREDPREISYEHFLRWIKRDPQRYDRFKEAQAMRTEIIAGEIIDIADAEDSVEDVQRSKLRIETRKFLMGAWNKQRYGEVKQIELGGSISITDALAAAQARIIESEVIDVTPNEDNND